MAELGRAAATRGSTCFLHWGHQWDGITCSVASTGVSRGMSSTVRRRLRRAGGTAPAHSGQTVSGATFSRRSGGGVAVSRR